MSEEQQEAIQEVIRAEQVILRWRGKGRNGDAPFDYWARVLGVWVRENGRWRNVAAQSTALEGPGGA